MLLATCASMVLLTALLGNALLPLRGRLANWLALGLLCAAQIVLLAEVLSELHALSRTGFVAGHLIMLGVVGVFWWRAGRPPLLRHGRVRADEIRTVITSHRMLVVFAATALFLAGLVLLSAQSEPQLSYDAVTYHLPRALSWLDNASAHHFPTDNHRQIEFPPNVSFYLAWIIALNGPDAVELPNWLAGIGLVGAIAGLARLGGFSRAASLFAGVMYLVMPQPFDQLVVVQIDLATAFPGVCFVYFAWRSVDAHARGMALRHNFDLVYAGIAFGVLVGSKLTALYLLPGIAIALLLYAMLRMGKQVWRPLVALAAACGVGFLLLGSYNYILNWLDFGNPITDQDVTASSDLLAVDLGNDPDLRPHFFSFPANLLRYSFEIMDWVPLTDVPLAADAESLNRRAYQRLDAAFDLEMAAISEFTWSDFGSTGFGLFGYVAFLISPLVGVRAVVRARQQRQAAINAAWVLIAWSWLLLFAATAAWSPWKTRYFPVFMPFIVAAVIPAWYEWGRRTPYTRIALGVLMFFSLWIGVKSDMYPVVRYFAVPSESALGYEVIDEPVESNYLALRDIVPEGAVVGIAGKRVDAFSPVRYVPNREYVAVRLDDISSQLATRAVDFVLVQKGYCPLGDLPFTSLLEVDRQDVMCVYPADPVAFLQHSAFVSVTDSALHVEFGIGSPAFVISSEDGPRVVLQWLAEQFPATEDAYRVEITFDHVFHDWAVDAVMCGDERLLLQVIANRVSFSLPETVVEQAAPVVTCDFVVHEPEVSGQRVTVRAAN